MTDRDSGHWIRDNPQENERRRKLFWEIYAYGVIFFLVYINSYLTMISCLIDSWIVSNEVIVDQNTRV